jgi:preprotein translocase subunit YajC
MEILLFLPLLLILMYVLLIRPQQQRVRQQQSLLSSIEPGDEVVTVSGIVGHVEAIEDDRVYIEVAPGVTIAMLRQALGRKVEHPADVDDEVDDDVDDEAEDEVGDHELDDHVDHELDDPELHEERADGSHPDGTEKSGPRRGRRSEEGPEEIAG